ncbi:hypothetical protein NKI41_32450 [Mesorhizobium sp. M0601]|uniref:hypothetical protein n=1 Tax=Mesorhizobium sp. M0601 TaxID=2956969 RepID=UPI00333995BC
MADDTNIPIFEMFAYDCSILQFEGWDGPMARFDTVLSKMLGGPLPKTVGDTARHDNWLVIRIAPRRFWLLCDGTSPSVDVDADLGCALPLGEGRARLRLSGRGLKYVLERCVALIGRT